MSDRPVFKRHDDALAYACQRAKRSGTRQRVTRTLSGGWEVRDASLLAALISVVYRAQSQTRADYALAGPSKGAA